MYRMINCSVEDQLRSTFESAYWAVHYNDACLVYRDKEKGDMYAIQKDGDSIALFERYTGSLGMIPIAHGYEDVASCVEEIQPNIAKWQVY